MPRKPKKPRLDKESKNIILKETIRGTFHVLQGLVSHPAGLIAIGLVSAPLLKELFFRVDKVFGVKIRFSRQELLRTIESGKMPFD